jgi:hypothetical protein
MNLKNRKIRPCDLNESSHKTCSYINAITMLCYSYIYDMIFITLFKISQGQRPPPKKRKIMGMCLKNNISVVGLLT